MTRSVGPWVTATLLVWLILFQGARLYTTPLAYDDALLASAAKSLAFGYGYATHGASPRLFDVELTVGPPLQIPAAGLVELFGNQYWVPGLATVCAIDILILAILLHLRRRLEPECLHGVVIAIFLAFAVLTADRDGWMLSHWYTFLGNIPASLAVILAVLLLSRDLETEGVPRMATGLLMGVAIETKLIAFLGVAPAVLWGVLSGYRSGRSAAVRRSLSFAGAVLIPVLLVEAWAFVALGGLDGYVDHVRAWRSFLASPESGSGISGFKAAIASQGVLFPRAIVNASVATDYFGGSAATVAVLVLVSLIGMRVWRADATHWPRPGEQRMAAGLLWAALVVHSFWWVTLSPTGWTNHLLPALLYFGAALALSLTVPTTRSLLVATSVAAAIVVLPRLVLLTEFVPRFSPDPQIRAALEVRDLLLEQKAKGIEHLGCGWWTPRDLEYLLPEVGNFHDCAAVDPSAFAAGRVVLVRNVKFWNWEHDARMQQFGDACERTPVFRNADYVLSRCGRPPVQALEEVSHQRKN